MIESEFIEEMIVRFFTDITCFNTNINEFFWQMEKMYWYYIDVKKTKEHTSKSSMKKFVNEIKDYLLCLFPVPVDLDMEYEKWNDSRKTVPRCKVILLDKELKNVVLTKCTNNDFLIFPGGKVDKDDKDLLETAIRETYEEIGVDVSNLIQPNLYFDVFVKNFPSNRYYVVPNIDKTISMCPNVYNEIEYIKWFPLEDLPNNISKHHLRPVNVKLIRESVEKLKIFLANNKLN